MASSSTAYKKKGSTSQDPSATQQDATIAGPSTGEQVEIGTARVAHRVPRPRPTSIFMPHYQSQFKPGSEKSPKDKQIAGSPLVPRHHIENLYKSGARIWTGEDLRAIEEHINALINHFEEHEPFQFRCFDDSMTTIEDVNPHFMLGALVTDGSNIEPLFSSKPNVAFRMYQDLLYNKARGHDKIAHRGLAICCEGIPNIPTVALTEHQVLQLYLHEKEKWDKSDTCSKLKLIIATSKIPTNINKMVCFGLGNLESGYLASEEPTHHRSIVQHAAALTISAAVQRKLNKPIKIYAQDPNYSLYTKRTLARQEIHVIDCHGAKGFTYVDEDTIVFSVAPSVPVKQIIADLARPPVMIWEKVSSPEEEEEKLKNPRFFMGGYVSPWTLDNDSPRTQKLVKHCTATPFPADDGHFMPNLTIYIRKPSM
ncbi:hypothetical protein F4810DRAFT_719848 [Camillea tinctor]|nr:hypothetical protein F4810DRAFT_719848 [Camillea tinctor]